MTDPSSSLPRVGDMHEVFSCEKKKEVRVKENVRWTFETLYYHGLTFSNPFIVFFSVSSQDLLQSCITSRVRSH